MTPTPYRLVDAGPTIRRVLALRDEGWSTKQIAAAAGITHSRLSSILTQKQVSERVANNILGVGGVPKRPIGRVPAWPYARMVQSLQAAGHTQPQIARAVGRTRGTISWIGARSGGGINADTANAIRDYWNLNKNAPAGDPTGPAQAHQWVDPQWWHDIDDPNERPGVTHCRICHSAAVAGNGLCQSCQSAVTEQHHDDD